MRVAAGRCAALRMWVGQCGRSLRRANVGGVGRIGGVGWLGLGAFYWGAIQLHQLRQHGGDEVCVAWHGGCGVACQPQVAQWQGCQRGELCVHGQVGAYGNRSALCIMHGGGQVWRGSPWCCTLVTWCT